MLDYTGRNVLYYQKELLNGFWEEHTATHKVLKRRGVTFKTREQTLRALRRLGEVNFTYNSSHTREHFNKIKNNSRLLTGFKLCFCCGNTAKDRHHIIWLKHGGRNSKRNIVALCRPCHTEIHPWLKGV